MPPHVNISRIRPKLETVDEALVKHDLAQVFAADDEVTAYQVLSGFEINQDRKLVLAVETVRSAPPTQADVQDSAETRLHIVKLGWTSQVAADGERWEACCRGRKLSMRMFVPVRKCELDTGKSGPRAAAVYEDASQLFGPLNDGEQISTLASAFQRAALHHDVSAASVERVLRQVYAELGRWFYHPREVDRDAGRRFFSDKLRLARADTPDVFALWEADRLRRLRGDAIWLLFDQRHPDAQQRPDYLDPVEFLSWAFQVDGNGAGGNGSSSARQIPATLVSASHGDLHGYNVLLGVSCGEAEYPVVIDYGDMSRENAVVWDFVKMETELKARCLHDLFDREGARHEVFASAQLPHHQKLVARWLTPAASELGHERHERGHVLGRERSQHILFAFLFEKLLAAHVASAFASQKHDSPIKSPRTDSPVHRALSLLARIRLEAAHHLGRQGNTWNEEYDFALAVNGLSTAKYG